MDIELLLPLAVVFIGLVCLLMYIVAAALRDITRQMTKTNEKLLIMLGAREGVDVGRALVAAARPPQRTMPGVAAKKPVEKKKDKPKQTTWTIGQP